MPDPPSHRNTYAEKLWEPYYTVLASYPGSLDYLPATAQVGFTITTATATVSVSDPGDTYSGSAFPATATLTGVGGVAGSSLEGIAPTIACYSGSTASGTPTAVAPTQPGTYSAVASFAGSADYLAQQAQATFAIAKHGTTTSVVSSNPVATPGQSAIYTATVAGGLASPALPTGTVQFQINGQNAGSAVAVGSNGAASYTTMATSGVTAIYSGDVDFLTSTSPAASQVILGIGVTVSGTTLYVVGSNANDSVEINPAGSKTDGTTGLQIDATLNNVWSRRTLAQPFTAIVVYGYNGNDFIDSADSLTLKTTIVEGNGNNYVETAAGTDAITLGTGGNLVFGGIGAKTLTAQNASGTISYIQFGSGTPPSSWAMATRASSWARAAAW